ncbi:hypothetical protein [Aneurinibacillus tyrosinisolvens]|uniref:hypothetical protein n=1 Tax=Aneurinibacillus tyrosinisolvens TaxID=1443435 RepID=UPI00069C5ACE|nr:hypothetical protein [Aneurinibacillus tyrosinisolvens]
MRWLKAASPEQDVRNIMSRVLDNECFLTWSWPEGIQFVYIYKSRAGQELPVERITEKEMKLYTREEYKANAGYREIIDTIGRYVYRVYPCVREDGKLAVLYQENEENMIHVSTGKAKIYYSLKQRKGFFSKYKSVQMEIRPEVPVPKQVLCYVKKEGAYPAHKEDGTVFPFARDFEPGKNTLPEIEINKNDYLRIFFTDGKKYGEIYELIPE